MDSTFWVLIIMVFVFALILREQRNAITKKIIRKKSQEDRKQMLELARRFIEKECIVYTFIGTQITGTIKEVAEGAILLENNNTVEAVNLDFVVRIREYPRDKKGRKKSLVLD